VTQCGEFGCALKEKVCVKNIRHIFLEFLLKKVKDIFF